MKIFISFFIFMLWVEGIFGAQSIKIATTTSTENSGLLEHIIPDFEKKYSIDVHVIAAGTGKAIKLGENGDCDLILIHDRASEEKFIKDGFGSNQKDVMWNDFVLIGPSEDPLRIKDSKDIIGAFGKIYQSGIGFISRADESGTHKKEMSLWQEAGLKPKGRWYLETGQGMGASLIIAHEKKAYILSDRATYLNYRDKTDLIILFEGDERFFNPYSIIAVNPKRHPHVRYREAMRFIEWIISDDIQKKIGSYRKYGEILFHPYVSNKCP